MLANTAMLQTVSYNISNANTEGYSRQSVELATEGGQFSGAGFFGRGVRIQTVSRSSDQFLTREANVNLSASSADQTRLDKLKQMEKVFQTGEAGIGYAASQMLNAFVDVANQPQDLSARQVALARAQDFVSRASSASTQLDSLQSGVLADMKTTVAQINDYAKQIASINQKIAVVQGNGHSPNDLLDTRDQLVKELNTKVQVSTIEAGDGTISVFMGGGQRLVLGNQAETLNVEVDKFDATMGRLSITTPNGNAQLDQATITGGSLKGLLQTQDEDIPAARNQLGQLVSALAWRVNNQQGLGLDLSGNPGASVFGIAAPAVLPSRTNSSSLSNPPVSLTVTDGRELQASEYLLEEDPNAPGTLRLLRDNQQIATNVVDGTQIDGLRININGAVPSGDQFLLRPVANAATTITRLLDKPTGLAAASPVTATVSASNKGTATLASLSVSSPNTVPHGNVEIVFTEDLNTTDNSVPYTLTDLTNGTSVTGTWTPGNAISYNGWNLNLNGVPKGGTQGANGVGDKIEVNLTTNTKSNNGNALTMLSIRDEDVVGRQRDYNNPLNTPIPGASITTAYSQLIGNIGVTVQSATTSADISGKLSDDSETLLKNKTGVNLDEEAAKMIQYQQNYQAAAKVLQVAQSVFSTLLGVLGN